MIYFFCRILSSLGACNFFCSFPDHFQDNPAIFFRSQIFHFCAFFPHFPHFPHFSAFFFHRFQTAFPLHFYSAYFVSFPLLCRIIQTYVTWSSQEMVSFLLNIQKPLARMLMSTSSLVCERNAPASIKCNPSQCTELHDT